MAKQVLPVNYQDDIVSESMNDRRRYNMIQNSDGTVSLVDATEYDLVGTNFGAGQINAITQAVNESADATKIVENAEDCSAVTEEGYIASAKALGQVNRNLEEIPQFIIDEETGKITGYTTKNGGADTVFPFSGNGLGELIWEDTEPYTKAVNSTVIDCDYTQYVQINILFNETYWYATYPKLSVKCCNLTDSLEGWVLYNQTSYQSGSGGASARPITFADGKITIASNNPTSGNSNAYNIPVKVFGVKNEESVIK